MTSNVQEPGPERQEGVDRVALPLPARSISVKSVRTAPKSKKRPPTSITPGDDSYQGSEDTTTRRDAASTPVIHPLVFSFTAEQDCRAVLQGRKDGGFSPIRCLRDVVGLRGVCYACGEGGEEQSAMYHGWRWCARLGVHSTRRSTRSVICASHARAPRAGRAAMRAPRQRFMQPLHLRFWPATARRLIQFPPRRRPSGESSMGRERRRAEAENRTGQPPLSIDGRPNWRCAAVHKKHNNNAELANHN